MTISEKIGELRTRLSPQMSRAEIREHINIIAHSVFGFHPVDLVLHGNRELQPYLNEKLSDIVDRIIADEPIQQIVGEEYFCGNWLKVTPDVLIPRPETAQLCDIIVDRHHDTRELHIADFCTGSGCIAVTLARALPFSEVYATDISVNAIEVAKQNADKLGVSVAFEQVDLLTYEPPNKAIFDIIVSNPPYILASERESMQERVLKYEPHIALFAYNNDPIIFYRRLLKIAAYTLNQKGVAYFEINPLTVEFLKIEAKKHKFSKVDFEADLYGKIRFMIVEK